MFVLKRKHEFVPPLGSFHESLSSVSHVSVPELGTQGSAQSDPACLPCRFLSRPHAPPASSPHGPCCSSPVCSRALLCPPAGLCSSLWCLSECGSRFLPEASPACFLCLCATAAHSSFSPVKTQLLPTPGPEDTRALGVTSEALIRCPLQSQGICVRWSSHHTLGNPVLMDSKSTVRVFSKVWKLRNLCGRGEDEMISPEEHSDCLFYFFFFFVTLD